MKTVKDLKPGDICYMVDPDGNPKRMVVSQIKLKEDETYELSFFNIGYIYSYSNDTVGIKSNENFLKITSGSTAINYHSTFDSAIKSEKVRTVFLNLVDAIERANKIISERMQKVMADAHNMVMQMQLLKSEK